MGKCRCLDLWESFFWYAPQLSGASILWFLSLSPLRVPRWDGCRAWLGAWPRAASLSPCWFASGLTVWCGCSGLMAATPLFTDMAGSIFHLHVQSPLELEDFCLPSSFRVTYVPVTCLWKFISSPLFPVNMISSESCILPLSLAVPNTMLGSGLALSITWQSLCWSQLMCWPLPGLEGHHFPEGEAGPTVQLHQGNQVLVI